MRPELSWRPLEAAKAQADVDSAKMEAAKASLEAAKARFQAATKQLNAAKSRFEAAKSQLDSARAALEAEKSHLLDEKAALEQKVAEAESKTAELEREKLALNSQLQKCRVEVGDLSEKMKELAKQLEQCNKDKKTMQEAELPGLREKVKDLKEQLKQCREGKKEPESEKPHVQDQKGNPQVFFDIDITRTSVRRVVHRVVIELDADSTPITAERFRALCTGEKGEDGSGTTISYKGTRLIRYSGGRYMFAADDIRIKDAFGVVSYYTCPFPAENPTKKHTGPGIVSMLSYQGDPNTSHGSRFMIITAKEKLWDDKSVVFGQVVEGMDVLLDVMYGSGSADLVITDCGQLNS